MMDNLNQNQNQTQALNTASGKPPQDVKEKILQAKKNGMLVLTLTLALETVLVLLSVFFISTDSPLALQVIPMILACICWLPLAGLRVLKPQEALVITLFGDYIGTLKGPGFYAVNPFCSSFNPAKRTQLGQSRDVNDGDKNSVAAALLKGAAEPSTPSSSGNVISLKVMTLNNSRQKVNDALGNPVEVGVAVMWRVVDTAKAVFTVDNFKEYLSLQCDAAVRNVVKIYPYDVAPNIDTTGDGQADDGSLRGSTEVVAKRIRDEIQSKVEVAGLEILDARITYLAYAPEIAAAMLQRQQASAIVDARKLIVDGAVGMVQMALEKLKEDNVVDLDDERKAAMVSNLLVVLCGNRDAQPVVNSGSLY
jgi:regulator of protease activity HflC (stomatin/prohibitin superfamily)